MKRHIVVSYKGNKIEVNVGNTEDDYKSKISFTNPINGEEVELECANKLSVINETVIRHVMSSELEETEKPVDAEEVTESQESEEEGEPTRLAEMKGEDKPKLDPEDNIQVDKDEPVTDLMLDIETLGTKPGCVILSISAVPFNLEKGLESMALSFHRAIDIGDSLMQGFTIEQGTVDWWNSQSQDAKKEVFSSESGSTKIAEALERFTDYYNSISCGGVNPVRIWGNGPTFDVSILDVAYTKVGMKSPWPYGLVRDVRTLVDLAKIKSGRNVKKEVEFIGTPHSSIDDCKHQIKYCIAAIDILDNELEKKLVAETEISKE